jgi:hypothetical protein
MYHYPNSDSVGEFGAEHPVGAGVERRLSGAGEKPVECLTNRQSCPRRN